MWQVASRRQGIECWPENWVMHQRMFLCHCMCWEEDTCQHDGDVGHSVCDIRKHPQFRIQWQDQVKTPDLEVKCASLFVCMFTWQSIKTLTSPSKPMYCQSDPFKKSVHLTFVSKVLNGFPSLLRERLSLGRWRDPPQLLTPRLWSPALPVYLLLLRGACYLESSLFYLLWETLLPPSVQCSCPRQISQTQHH